MKKSIEKKSQDVRREGTFKRLGNRLCMGLLAAWLMFEGYGFYAYAGVAKMGTNIKNWIVNELLGPVCLVIVAILCVKAYTEKAWVKLIVSAIGGGVVYVLITNPDFFVRIGNTFVQIIFG